MEETETVGPDTRAVPGSCQAVRVKNHDTLNPRSVTLATIEKRVTTPTLSGALTLVGMPAAASHTT